LEAAVRNMEEDTIFNFVH